MSMHFVAAKVNCQNLDSSTPTGSVSNIYFPNSASGVLPKASIKVTTTLYTPIQTNTLLYVNGVLGLRTCTLPA